MSSDGMRIGIIAEGFADANVIKAIVKRILRCDGSDIRVLRPEEAFDATDLKAMNFSNWGLVFETCRNEEFMGSFLDGLEGDALVIVHVDTAERGEKGYDVQGPVRTGQIDAAAYTTMLRANVKRKIDALVAEPYRDRIAYAIAIEETDAWLIPLFENRKIDSALYANLKERLQTLIGTDKKRKKAFVDASRGALDYAKLGKELSKSLSDCRRKNKSLDLFCLEVAQYQEH